MKRITLVTILMMMVGTSVFAQTDKFDLAKTAAQEKQEELLANMKSKLENPKEYKQLKADLTIKDNENQQFLYEESRIDSLLKIKSHTLNDVFKKLTVNKADKNVHFPTQFNYEGQVIGTPHFKTNENSVDSLTIIVPIRFQTHTITKNSISNVKYEVTLEWAVKVKEKRDKEGKLNYTINSTKLNSSKATPIEYLTSEKVLMLESAKKHIVEWYADLPNTLNDKYVQMSVDNLVPIRIDLKDVNKEELPNSKNFEISSVPEIRIKIDPYQYIKDNEELLYTDPVSFMVLSPKFNISMDNTLKGVDNMTVEYVEKEIVKPIKDAEKEVRQDKAKGAIETLNNRLFNYVTDKNDETKSMVETMFVDENVEVEVSHLFKNGSERRTIKPVKKYLSLLKGLTLTMDLEHIEVNDPNWDSIVCTVNQQYRSVAYSDDTIKKVYLDFNQPENQYKVSKIEVVSTQIK